MRKVYVNVTIGLIINAEDSVNIDDFLSDIEYDFVSTDTDADIIDTEIVDWKITDSK